jgi:cytochrome c-type biogenesis protein CcmH/NrfG
LVPGALSFAVILVLLAAAGALGLLYRPPAPRGLPHDPAVEAARAALASLVVDTGNLRFATSLDGADRPAPAPSPADLADPHRRLALAERRLLEAAGRHPRDPRIATLLGHVELAAQRLERAERRYRSALALAPRHGEARLGLGVALARQAATRGDARAARRLRLGAIAQLAAVEQGDPFHPHALYDRVLLLIEVGRLAEARRWAERYAELEPGSPWTVSLARAFPDP